MEPVRLEEAVFKFSQEGNCIDEEEIETLTIECKADIGIDGAGSCFYVIKTEQWSFDSLDDLQKLIDRISKTIKDK